MTEEQPVKHQSYVLVYDDFNHNSTTVITFVKEIIKDITELDPDVEYVQYSTDSPTSDYRNQTLFNLIANHKDAFGILVRWNYFEAGHGKGHCNGRDASAKYVTDKAMISGKIVVSFLCLDPIGQLLHVKG